MRSFTPLRRILGPVAALAAATWSSSAPAQDAAGAVAAFAAAREWLDVGGPDATVPTPPDVRSAAVVLRLHGRPVGFGKDPGTPGAQDSGSGSPVDRALRSALAQARERLARRPAGEPDPAALSLELELAGVREPLIGRTFEEVARPLEPAECGLQLIDGDRVAYVPASHLLGRRMAAPVSRGIVAMITEAGLPALDLPDLQALGGNTAVYAARGVRLAQAAPADRPFVLARALPVAAVEPLARAGGAALVDGIVRRLAAQLAAPAPAEGLPADAALQIARTGLRGDYLVHADLYEPFAAGPADQAFAALALARAASTETWPPALRDAARTTATAVLAALAEVDPSERDPAGDPGAIACIELALAELGSDPLPKAFGSRVRDALRAAVAPAALLTVPPATRAMLLDAAAARAGDAEPPMPRERLDSEIGALLDRLSAAELPATGLFALDALSRLHGPGWLGTPAARRDAIEAARTVLLAVQWKPHVPDAPASVADMAGAYPMAGSPAGRASAQSLRVHAFMAMVAAAPGTRTPARDDEDRATLGWAGRFAAQLVASGAIAYCAPAPDRAVGGVLASTADASQPLAAQAMAILALAEAERALTRLDGAPAR